jgi:hypothetical protein
MLLAISETCSLCFRTIHDADLGPNSQHSGNLSSTSCHSPWFYPSTPKPSTNPGWDRSEVLVYVLVVQPSPLPSDKKYGSSTSIGWVSGLPTLQRASACPIPPSANSSAHTRRQTRCSRKDGGCILELFSRSVSSMLEPSKGISERLLERGARLTSSPVAAQASRTFWGFHS